MGRNRESLGMRVFSCVMCFVLVVGLVPTQALSEAADEVATGNQLVAEAPSNDDGANDATDAVVGDGGPAEEERPASEEQQNGEGEGEVSETSTSSSDSDKTTPSDTDAAKEDGTEEKDEAKEKDESKEADKKDDSKDDDKKDDDKKDDDKKDEQKSDDMPAFEGEQIVDGVKVAVKAEAGVFPAGAQLLVQKATPAQEEQVGEAVEEVRDEGKSVAESYTFDVKVLDANGNEVQPSEGKAGLPADDNVAQSANGNEAQPSESDGALPADGNDAGPAEGQKVEVSFSLAEVADKNLETQVYHVTEDDATGKLAAESLDVSTQATPETGEQTTAVVETDGFSLYTVEFTYGDLQYVMPGDSEVPLSAILTAVSLTGEVSAAEVSNDELFSVSNETGEWVVTAHQAFNTTEWLKVTINDVTYNVTVTDAETKTVSYIEQHWDGTKVVSEEKTRNDVKNLPSSGAAIPGGWYFVDGLRRFNERICFTGDTHLILRSTDVDHVFERGWLNADGIYIPEGCTLSIYGQGENQDLFEGRIDVYYTASGAAIGGYPGHTGGNVEVHGGIVNVCGATNCAGIGGSDGQSQAGSLTVYGGYVRTEGGDNGAGIGGGRGGDGGNVIIYGGDVEPKGGENAAGIGGGKGGNGGTVTVNGGTIRRPQKSNDPTVYYNGGDNGAGIGGGQGGQRRNHHHKRWQRIGLCQQQRCGHWLRRRCKN